MPDGYILQKTRKNARAMLVWALIFMALYIWYMCSAFIYLPNAVSSGHSLNYEKLASSSSILTIEPEQEPFNYSEYYVTIPDYLMLEEVYVDGYKYRFKIQIENVEEVGIAYKLNSESILEYIPYDPESGVPSDAVQKLVMFTVNGTNYVGLLAAAQDFEPSDTLEHAVLVQLPLYAGHDLGLTEYAGSEVSSYAIDMRMLEVGDESTDFIFIIFFSIVFPLFFAYCIVCMITPKFHPNYLRISKFDDVAKVCHEIDEELKSEDTYSEGRTTYTKHYIIEHTWYTTKVKKNHLLRH